MTLAQRNIDVIVPTDGRHHRMLDLDEYADAMADGTLSLEDASTACGDGNDSWIAIFMPTAGRNLSGSIFRWRRYTV
jgi:hypothetical protein